MRDLNAAVALVGLGLILGCRRETTNNPDKRFAIPTRGYPVSVGKSGSEQVDALVRQLVSKRPAPYRSGDDPPIAVVFADRYSTPEVESALKRLKKMGPAVFPALVKHLGDDRYSYSGVVAAWLNYHVGDAVVEVLSDGHYMHSGYKVRESPSGSFSYLSFDHYLKARGAEAWAEWASTKTPLNIQMDFIDWCIVKENERGYVDEAQKKKIAEIYEAARQQVMKEYSEQDDSVNRRKRVRSETNRTSSAADSRR
jgi:hypothetical protein